ncbi:MAG TPA: peptidylprolyl isomerase [Candidatus Polarisedimenticolaceae bacterium]|nr:peptidylprolyl isomerase [Candidatus Polarisedimenticolaceae bacterium]
MRRLPIASLLALLVALVSLAAAPADGVKAVLELDQNFYYVGDPFLVKISIGNDGTTEAPNPVKAGLLEGFEVESGNKKLEATGKAAAAEPTRPAKLAPKAFYGTVVDLTQLYPELKNAGSYRLRWSSDGVKSDAIELKIIPKFDPAKDYQAQVDTEEGSFVIDLLESRSPVAVKAFVDLCNAGFYDGLILHDVRPDQAVAGGDPTGTGQGQAPFRFPAELSAMPVLAGTVVLKPAGLAPPSNSSQFVIALRPEPRWTGQFTVLGQVVQGLEVIKKISNVPSEKPSFRPSKDIHTLRIRVVEKESVKATP